MNRTDLWKRYHRHLCKVAKLGLTLDISRMDFGPEFLQRMAPNMQRAYDAMAKLEAGAIANPDEQRQVGHYWLRNAELTPNASTKSAIITSLANIRTFVAAVHRGEIHPAKAKKFTDVLLIGIGGSALGPQLVADALGGRGGASGKRDRMRIHFFDNTDPDGFNRMVAQIGARLKSTLTLVVSKSGGTKETRNGMLAAKEAYQQVDLHFAQHAVAVTGKGSQLGKLAQQERWLKQFEMWDWVGGRTSVMSAVGLLPAALQGVNIDAFLQGAAEMDQATRLTNTKKNPAALMALMWFFATNGRGEKDMVVLPYKDRLLLMSRYLQQLVMESLGKQHDLDGAVVHQGVAVYGNKGSTDQHAYVQQLRDGVNNFFAVFITVLQDGAKAGSPTRRVKGDVNLEVEPNVTSGDYLNGFWQGTREALYEGGRGSITITLKQLNARTLGGLIALFERAVGFYATLINVNAYHQPGVEAGKKAAENVLDIQRKIISHLRQHPGQAVGADELAKAIALPDRAENVAHILEHLSANKRFVKSAGSRYKTL